MITMQTQKNIGNGAQGPEERKADWIILNELLLYFWKVEILVGDREYGAEEDIDPVTGMVSLDLETYLLPDEVSSYIGEILADPTRRSEDNPLTALLDQGLIQREEKDRVFTCPVCNSAKVRPRGYCPNCGSFRIVPTRLVQHVICGYTGPEAEFETEKEGEYRCPSCGARFSNPGDQLTVFGSVFYCESCGRVFKDPQYRFVCLNKDTVLHPSYYEFNPLDSSYTILFRYRLSDKGRELVSSGKVIIDSIARYVEEKMENLKIYRGDDTKKLDFLPREVRALGFDLVLVNPAIQKVVTVDYTGRDVVPYVMKATVLSGTGLDYVLIVSPTLSSEKTGFGMIEELSDNVTFIDLSQEFLSSIVERVLSLVKTIREPIEALPGIIEEKGRGEGK